MARKNLGAAALLAAALAFGLVLTGCGAGGDKNPDLIGAWDWTDGGMEGAITLLENGRYTWLGVNYGALGFRWHSGDGTVFARLGPSSTPWFYYQLIDSNTLRIEYAEIAIRAGVTGVFYLHRGQ